MKKELLVGVVLVTSMFVFSSLAMAAIETSGTIEWKIYGSNEKIDGDEVASPIFKYGDVRMHYDVMLTTDSWEVLFAPRIRLDDDPQFIEDDGSYIKAYMNSSSVMFKPRLDYAVFDVYSGIADGEANIPKEPGIKFDIPMKPLDMTLEAVVNSTAVYKNTGGTSGHGDMETKFNYGAGLTFAVAPLSVGVQFITTDVTSAIWYGSAYGAKLEVDLSPISLTAEFVTWSPEFWWCNDGSGVYGKVGYDLGAGLGNIALEYKGSDKNFNGVWMGPTDGDYSKLKGEYSYPLAQSVNMVVGVAKVNFGFGWGDFTEYELKFAASL